MLIKRLKTNYNIAGTETYRTSTSILKPPIRPKEMGWAIQTATKHGDIGEDIRKFLVADKGCVLVNMDQSQAEARVCSKLADDEETLKAYDTIDVHALTASKFFGGGEARYSKKLLGYECPERFVGKTLRHAFHLDIGKHEAMINVNTDARKYNIKIRISESTADSNLKILRRMTPKIPEVFHATIQALLAQDRRIYGTLGASRYFYEDWGRDLFKEAYAFIPQQTVTDNTKKLALKIREVRWDLRIAVESHDSLCLIVPEKEVDGFIEEAREYQKEPIDFSVCSIPRSELLIPWDFEVGYNYCDFEKYRKKAA